MANFSPFLIAILFIYTTSAFRITKPTEGEIIDVVDLYELQWSTDDVPSRYQLFSIEVGRPDPQNLKNAGGGTVYMQGWGEATYNVSGTAGRFQMNLTNYWAPFYDEVPHGTWSIFLELFDFEEKIRINTALNYTVNVTLMSSASSSMHRPQLTKLNKTVLDTSALDDHVDKPASGTLAIVLGVAAPALLIGLIILLFRLRWHRHSYGALSAGQKHDAMSAPKDAQSDETCSQGLATVVRTSQKMTGLSSFVLAVGIALVPLLALFWALVILLLVYRVQPTTHVGRSFEFNNSGSDSTALYIELDATQYTTVASWTSSIALLLPGFLTTLIWFRQAEQFEDDSSHLRLDRLTTPYQLSLLLGLKSGTLASLWDYVRYICSRRREQQSYFLFNAGFVVSISTLLGLGLWMADTWLHVATSTVPLTTAYNYSRYSVDMYGRSLSPSCTTEYLSASGQNFSCLLESLLADVPPVLTDMLTYSSVLGGLDDDIAIIPVSLGRERMAYIGPAHPWHRHDYRASTVAVRSTCDNIDDWCFIPPNENGTYGDVYTARCGKFGLPMNESGPFLLVTQGVTSRVTTFFTDQNWQTPMFVDNVANSFYTVNRIDSPYGFYYGLPSYWSMDKNSRRVYSTFIGCHTELLNLTYTYVNQSIRAMEMRPLQSLELMNAIYSPANQNFNPYITSGAAVTASVNDVDSALQNWMDTINKDLLALATIATEATDNLHQQSRSDRLVARIPKAPLFTLGMLLLISIAFNSWVVVSALWRSKLKTTCSKQTVISVAGLAATVFDNRKLESGSAVTDVWNLFEESRGDVPSVRIGIIENQNGGSRLVAYSDQEDQGASGRNAYGKRESVIHEISLESPASV